MKPPAGELPQNLITGLRIHPGIDQPENASQLHILVAKQDMVYAEALAWTASHVFPTADIKTVGRGSELLRQLYARVVDFLILGLSFPDMDGLDLLQQVTDQRLARHVLVVADVRDELLIPRLQTARVDAILDISSETLAGVEQALSSANAGHAYVSPTLYSYLVDRHKTDDNGSKLSPAELRVLRLIGIGLDNKEAGEALCLSEATVQTHRRNIMHKLNVSTSPKLVREAIRLGLARIPAHTPAVGRESR